MAPCLLRGGRVTARPPLMLFGIFLYFLLVVAVLALVYLPPLRERAATGVSGLWRRGLARGTAWRLMGRQQTARRAESLQDSSQRLERAVRRHWRALTAAAIVIVAFPLGAVMLQKEPRNVRYVWVQSGPSR